MNSLHRRSIDWLETRFEELEELGLEDGEEYSLIDKILNDKIETRAKNIALDAERRQEESMRQRITEHKDRVSKKYGNYEDWFQWAMSLYTITNTYKVVSAACNWKEEMSWRCDCKVEALEKIEQLVIYKEYDHFKRGSRQ